MEVYPTIFPHHEILNVYEPTRKTVTWRLFASNLNRLFHFFHDVKQTLSCFGPLAPGNVSVDLVGKSDNGYGKHVSDQFGATHTFYGDKHDSISETADGALMRQLEFFIPVFIWKFNYCKRNLIKLDLEIFEQRSLLSEHKQAVSYWRRESFNMPPIQSPIVKDRFLSGTALSLRKLHPLPPDGGAALLDIHGLRRKRGDDDDERMRVTTPWRHPDTGWFFSDFNNDRAPAPSGVRDDEDTPDFTAAPRRRIAHPRVRGRGSSRGRFSVGRRVGVDVHAGIGSRSNNAAIKSMAAERDQTSMLTFAYR